MGTFYMLCIGHPYLMDVPVGGYTGSQDGR